MVIAPRDFVFASLPSHEQRLAAMFAADSPLPIMKQCHPILAQPTDGIGGSLLVFLLMTVLGGAAPRQLVLHAVIAVLSVGAMWSVFTFGLRVLLPRGEIMPGI